jgi:hypothetical protein
MIKTDLFINGFSVSIGQRIDDLSAGKFERPGFFNRRIARKLASRMAMSCEDVLFSKNPTIQLFGDFETKLYGNDRSAKKLDDIYGTSAYIFIQSDLVVGVHIQLFDSYPHGYIFSRSVRRAALNKLGGGNRSAIKIMKRFKRDRFGANDAEYLLWSDSESYFLFQNIAANRNCHVHWSIGAPPLDISSMCNVSFSDNLDFEDAASPIAWMDNIMDSMKD